MPSPGESKKHRSRLKPTAFALGISATPERDDERHHEVYKRVGGVVYRYPLLRAFEDRVLAELNSIVLYVELTASERAQYETLTREIGSALMKLASRHPWVEVPTRTTMDRIAKLADEDPTAASLLRSVTDRRKLVAECSNRNRCVDAILGHMVSTERPRTIAFHDTIDGADWVSRSATVHGLRAAASHSRLKPDQDREAIDAFRQGRVDLLSTLRKLDEGFDVPEASCAVIVSGSKVQRQRIQRLGRVLRRTAPDSVATVYTILAKGTAEALIVGGRESRLVGPQRVRHHEWPTVPIETSQTERSTFTPASFPSVPSTPDLLDLFDQGLGHELHRGYPWLRVAKSVRDVESFARRLSGNGPEALVAQALSAIEAEDWNEVVERANEALRAIGAMDVAFDSYVTFKPTSYLEEDDADFLGRRSDSVAKLLQSALGYMLRQRWIDAAESIERLDSVVDEERSEQARFHRETILSDLEALVELPHSLERSRNLRRLEGMWHRAEWIDDKRVYRDLRTRSTLCEMSCGSSLSGLDVRPPGMNHSDGLRPMRIGGPSGRGGRWSSPTSAAGGNDLGPLSERGGAANSNACRSPGAISQQNRGRTVQSRHANWRASSPRFLDASSGAASEKRAVAADASLPSMPTSRFASPNTTTPPESSRIARSSWSDSTGSSNSARSFGYPRLTIASTYAANCGRYSALYQPP